MNDAFIYDFETLSQNPIDAALVSCAKLSFSFKSLKNNEYSYNQLLNQTEYMKFDVADQVKNWNRKVEQSTLEWWKSQSKEAIASIKPSDKDVSITRLIPWLGSDLTNNTKYVFTRNNTFDPVIVTSVCSLMGEKVPYDWWKIRDTKSFIFGLVYDNNIRDDFIPPNCDNYVKHDPRHDIVLDVMRLQTLIYHKFGDE